jgi:hypothetical protein
MMGTIFFNLFLLPILIKCIYMNKKLLLSFAVFATALTVNAQKNFPAFKEKAESSKPLKVSAEAVKRTDVTGDKSYYYWENNSRVTKELNTFLGKTGAADGGFDTLGLYTYKFKEKTTSSTYWQMAIQGFNTTDDLTLNSIKFVGASLNSAGANIVVNVVSKDLSTVLATKTVNWTNQYNYQTITFDTPVTSADTFLVTLTMATAADSFQIAKSHNQYNGSTLGTANTFTSSLPFKGDAAILAVAQNNASILGLIQQSFDFFVIPSFTYKLKSDFEASSSKVCLGDSVSFESNANSSHLYNPVINYIHWDYLANGNAPAYTTYSFGDGSSVSYSDTLNGGVVYSAAGEYEVTATTMLGTWITSPYLFNDTTKFTISVKEISLDSASVMATNDQTNDGKAIVMATGGFEPYSYEWSASAGTEDTVMVGKGSYSVIVTDDNGCMASASVTVDAGTASIAALAITGLNIYPNPTTNVLNVAFDSKSAATVELVNVAGQVIDTKTYTGVVKTSFNTANLNAGVYFVNIKVAEGTFTTKVVKN